MVVGQLIEWVEAAPAEWRAEATRALACACLRARSDSAERAALEAAITVLIDQSRSDVRLALAEAFADTMGAPRHVIAALAADQVSIAAIVLARSPLFIDAELIERLSNTPVALQVAIASRSKLSSSVIAAIAELASPEACLALVENARARPDRTAFARIAARFGGEIPMREALLAREDLPPEVHQALVQELARTLGAFVVGNGWVTDQRATAVTRDACDRATVTIAADAPGSSLTILVEHLRNSGQLTTALILRAACAGNLDFFEAALAALAGVPIDRIAGLVASRRVGSIRTIYAKAGLPDVAFAAFAAALDIWAEVADEGDTPDRYRTPTEVADAIVTRFTGITGGEGHDVATMLRRFAADQAREAAHEYARAAA